MNEETFCGRCLEEPATLLIEHAEYGEPVCKACRDDEDRYEIAKMFDNDGLDPEFKDWRSRHQ